jgi:ATP-dependent Clp protease ATP-binding subunit ClpE
LKKVKKSQEKTVFKPSLAAGEIQVIGATTLKEYREIEKDPALERRFQPVLVKEPSVEDTIEILKGLRPKYEAYHQVQYSDEVLEACALLSHRYIQDRRLPDKAIDLMDEAGSKANLRIIEADKEQLKKRLDEIAKRKEEAVKQENYELAAQLRAEESQLAERLAQKETQPAMETVTVDDIQLIVEKKTGIPVRKISRISEPH